MQRDKETDCIDLAPDKWFSIGASTCGRPPHQHIHPCRHKSTIIKDINPAASIVINIKS